jgi:hypothetical protein
MVDMAEDLQLKHRLNLELESQKYRNSYELQDYVVRQEAFVHFIRGLFLLHGGGVGVLLVFLQSMWDKSPQLSTSVVWGIAVLCVGLLLAGPLHLFRNYSSRSRQAGNEAAMWRFSRLYVLFGIVSLAMFPGGVGIIVFGALRQLPGCG